MTGFGMLQGVLLFWFVLLVMTVLLVRSVFRINRTALTVRPPLTRQMLEQRFASGEISKEEYLARLKDL